MVSNTITDLTETDDVHNADLFVAAQCDKYISKKFNSRSMSGEQLMEVLV